ncbi:E3 ubiquitin-protein ligase Topors-like [Heliangelus exortis]|uniref:E3 ubiquitin-protein ligase Topors-like n=1 Tax=Heliangelus exortis TaxID=472823 RepID=UPI003A8E2ABA
MATEQDSHCPICLDIWQEASYVMPCLHQFCYTCILRWTESKPECPLCRRRVTSILHSVRADNDFEEHVIPPPAAPSVVVQWAEGDPSAQNPHPPAAAQPSAAALLLLSHRVGGIYPHLWAFIFRVYPALLQPVLPWLQRELGLIFEGAQEAAAAAQRRVLSSLHLFGLDEGTLCRLLQDTLGRHTETFVRQLISTIVERCSREAQQRMGMGDAPAARGRQGSPAAVPSTAASRGGSPLPHPAPSSSPAGAHEEERPNTSTASLLGGPSSPPDAPVPTHGEQQELHEDPGEAVAGPSTPSQGRDRSRGGPRRATKRRASSSLDSSQPRKRPPRRPR